MLMAIFSVSCDIWAVFGFVFEMDSKGNRIQHIVKSFFGTSTFLPLLRIMSLFVSFFFGVSY